MTNYFFSQQDTQDALDKLDPQVVHALSIVNIPKTILEIGTKNSIHTDQLGIIEAQLTYLLTGLIDAKELTTRLKELLSLDDTKIETLIQDMNESIIKPIKDRILILQNEDVEDDEDEIIEEPVPIPAKKEFDPILASAELPSQNIVEQKLSSFAPPTPRVTTDHSVTKPALPQTNTTQRPIDPYREEIK